MDDLIKPFYPVRHLEVERQENSISGSKIYDGYRCETKILFAYFSP